LVPYPNVGGKSTYGGYCGPAVKPIALKMLASLKQDPIVKGIPISGIGGISTWKDAVEFILLGAANVQICTAVMKYGFRIINDLCDGLSNWMDDKGFRSIGEFIGLSVDKLTDWEQLDLNFHIVAKIDQEKCVHCGICYIACEDAAHQAIRLAKGTPYNRYEVIEEECVGCNLCHLICPIEECIVMEEKNRGSYINWLEYQKRGLPLNDH